MTSGCFLKAWLLPGFPIMLLFILILGTPPFSSGLPHEVTELATVSLTKSTQVGFVGTVGDFEGEV